MNYFRRITATSIVKRRRQTFNISINEKKKNTAEIQILEYQNLIGCIAGL